MAEEALNTRDFDDGFPEDTEGLYDDFPEDTENTDDDVQLVTRDFNEGVQVNKKYFSKDTSLNKRDFSNDISLETFIAAHGDFTHITIGSKYVTNTLGKTYRPRTMHFTDGVQVKLSSELCIQCDMGNNVLPGDNMFVYEEDNGSFRTYARPALNTVDTKTTLFFARPEQNIVNTEEQLPF